MPGTPPSPVSSTTPWHIDSRIDPGPLRRPRRRCARPVVWADTAPPLGSLKPRYGGVIVAFGSRVLLPVRVSLWRKSVLNLY